MSSIITIILIIIWQYGKTKIFQEHYLKTVIVLNPTKRQLVDKQVKLITIGDILYLKKGSMCPVDCLIIDSSEEIYSDKFAWVNEKSISGKTDNITKKSIILNKESNLDLTVPKN